MAQMTYLQLCQLTARLLRLGNAQSGTVPATIPPPANSEDVVYDIIDAVPRAYEWLQNQHPAWQWMRRQTLLDVQNTRFLTLAQIQAQVGAYAWSVPFHAATVHSPYALLYDAGAASPQTQMPIYFVNYIDWRGFMDRQPRPTGQPVRFTEWPDRTLEFDPTPTTAPSGLQWKLVLDCRVPNDVLTTQAQVPLMPVEYHETIAWIAARLVAITRTNKGQLSLDGDSVALSYLTPLRARYLPVVTIDMSYA